MKQGLLIVISGPAGSGKGTVNAHLLGTGDYVYSVSATTRAPRPGEVDGVNYHFITKEEFERRMENGDMLEYTEYCGNYYGTPRKEAEEVLKSGKNLILEIEVEGAQNVKKKFPEAVSGQTQFVEHFIGLLLVGFGWFFDNNFHDRTSLRLFSTQKAYHAESVNST